MREPALPGPRAPSSGPAAPGAAGRRFGVNAASNLAYFVLSTLTMLWYVPFLLRHLGVSAYGMVSLTQSLVLCAAFLSESLNAAVCRHLAIDLARGDTAAARRTFNGAAVLALRVCAGLLVPIVAVTWLFPVLFALPPGLADETRFLFLGVCATLLAAVMGSLFGASSQIAHRFDLRNAVRAATLTVRVGLVAACFAVWPASLVHVGAGLMASAALGLLCEILVWRALTPQLAFRPRAATPDDTRRCLGLGGWSAVNIVGFLLLANADLLVVNALYGPAMTGRYGSILLLPALIGAVAEVVTPMLSPAILARYAVGDRDGLARLTLRAIRFLGLALALPAGLVCGFGAPLLRLWLGPDFAALDPLLVLLCGHLAVNLALRPLAYVLVAHDRLRVPGLVSVGLGLANVGLAVGLARWNGWGIAGVAASSALIWTVKNALFLSWYAAGLVGLPRWTFTRALAGALVGLLGITAAGRVLVQIQPPATWPALAVSAGAVAAAYAALAYAAFLTRADRHLVRSLLPRRSFA